MRGISEYQLKELWDTFDEHDCVCDFAQRMLDTCEELNTWKPIDDNTPKDRLILVYAPCRDGLGDLITTCLWHDDAGFCIDMIREPTYWADLPTLPKAKL